jgi:pimeloyl-ACP methyl ester carboxylesterase
MRAEEPIERGHIVRDGVRTAYEVFGTKGPTLVMLPCWIIAHARVWKAQIADLAQDCRIIVVEGRGNGASDRPAGGDAYSQGAYLEDALAVIDHLGAGDLLVFGFSMGGPLAALLAQRRPDQVKAAVLIAPVAPLDAAAKEARQVAFLARWPRYEGWAKYNAEYIRDDYDGFVRFFYERMFPEPHSTKQVEDAVGWAMETTPEVLVDSVLGPLREQADIEEAYASLRCPVLIVQGDADEIAPPGPARKLAATCKAELVEMPGSGHGPHLRRPAAVNGAIREFLARHGFLPRPKSRPRSGGARRALYLSSPIGLGHARRDLAVARALRALRPDLEIDWLAQDPVTRVLRRAGEPLHPASARLGSESRHIEEEAGEHDLNVFQALRRMDEILIRNFRVFQDAVADGGYNLVIADESWEVDHFWHEHPQLKRVPLVWMTDFVGFAPMPEGGPSEAALTADYNGEMVGHVEQTPTVRDRAIFVGNPEDVVDDGLGPDLPGRRAWVDERFTYSGYILGDDVPRPEDRLELRERLGFEPDEKVCVVAVGGSGVGASLIRRVMESAPLARRVQPGLRTIVVTGPRLDPGAFPSVRGVELRGFEPELPKLLAACDVAVVQGGLSTCMELAATGTPFIYVPLQRHFEQNVHVPRRLEGYRAGRKLTFTEATAEALARTMVEEISGRSRARPVERDGASRAAQLIVELL